MNELQRVTAERDAALGREARAKEGLAEHWKVVCDQRTKIDALQQRLTAADERADVLEQAVVLLIKVTPRNKSSFADKRKAMEILAALKPAEAAPCCTVSAEDRALLEAGDYTPEELFGVGGKPSCPKCAKP